MGWSANETARIFDMTTVAVNSALQRARSTMKQFPGALSNILPPD